MHRVLCLPDLADPMARPPTERRGDCLWNLLPLVILLSLAIVLFVSMDISQPAGFDH